VASFPPSYKLDLFELLGEEPPPVPNTLFAKLSDEAGMVAARARDIIELPIAEQLGLKSAQRDDFPKILRRKIEAKGILVAKNSGLQHFGARGMCIFEAHNSIYAQIDGMTYYFSNEDAKATFMKDPQGNLAKARAYRKS
jgi:YHS domain-containing protein